MLPDKTFDPILSEPEYRALTGLSAPTAQRQRSDGSGPPFVQLSARRIGYRLSVVERWLDARTVKRVGALGSDKQAPQPALETAIATVPRDAERRLRHAADRERRSTLHNIRPSVRGDAVRSSDANVAERGTRSK
jgi:predicted DNA-binding transcriptional regulator AlpA